MPSAIAAITMVAVSFDAAKPVMTGSDR